MMDTKTGLKIAYRRKFLGMTQEQIAEKLGVSFQAVSNWERGETSPELDRLAEIARALQTTVPGLFVDNVLLAGGEKLFDEGRMFTYLSLIHI